VASGWRLGGLARQNSHSEKARARAKAWAPGIDAARRPAGLLIPDGIAGITGRLGETLSAWAAAETAPGRLLPWVPVAFGLGIVGYFAADREPAWWASLPLAVVISLVAYLARQRPIAFPVAVALAAMTAGFALATLQALRLGHPILQHPVSSALVAGFVEVREERERSDRIAVRVERFEAASIATAPQRVRVAVRKGTAPAVGSFVEFKAHLSPPLQPLRPGGYEFARDMYFQRIGASGYALGAIKVKSPPVAQGFWLRYASIIDALRDALDKRIRAVTGGDHGSIASALITGKRDAISAPVNDAMYVSSLAHVLSISGYHMAVVAGIVFFLIRAGLALIPSLASRHPIKKWAASGAIIAAAFYLLLSGAGLCAVATLVHHDCDCARRGDCGPGGTHFPDARCRCHRCPVAGSAGRRSSQLSDVVCCNARPDRDISACAAVATR
jgi:competence protein ComEC